jgi:hypothetical protein
MAYGGASPAATGSVPHKKGMNADLSSGAPLRFASTLERTCSIISALSVKVTLAPCNASTMPDNAQPLPSSTTRLPLSSFGEKTPLDPIAACVSTYAWKFAAESQSVVPCKLEEKD